MSQAKEVHVIDVPLSLIHEVKYRQMVYENELADVLLAKCRVPHLDADDPFMRDVLLALAAPIGDLALGKLSNKDPDHLRDLAVAAVTENVMDDELYYTALAFDLGAKDVFGRLDKLEELLRVMLIDELVRLLVRAGERTKSHKQRVPSRG